MARILSVPSRPSSSFWLPIVDLVRGGGLLAVGTESSYALATSVSVARALDRVVKAKRRPAGKPVLVLIADRSQLDDLASAVPPWAEPVLDAWWPGPLTVIFPAHPSLSPVLTAGTGTIGVREPAPAFLRTLLQHTGPLTGTSANRSGDRSCLTAEEVRVSLGDDVDVILDTGPAPGRQPSTLLSVADKPIILRAGPVSAHDIQSVLLETGLTVEVRSGESRTIER